MNAYLPENLSTIYGLLLILIGTLTGGFAITRLRSLVMARLLGWLVAILVVAGAERLCRNEPAGLRMLAIIGSLLYAMKAVVSVEAQAAGETRLTARQWFSFAIGWFGMRQTLFARLGRAGVAGGDELLRQGLMRLLTGLAFVLLALFLSQWRASWLPAEVMRGMATLFLLPGLSLMLHFGLFNILAGLWRYAGVDCNRLFRAPLYSTSLAEFWGRRWNLAFNEMTAIGIYRPLVKPLGRSGAVVIAFLFSGVLHELAISVPVKAGLGLPLLYFCLQGLLVLYERRRIAQGRPVDQVRWIGRTWTICWLILPLPLLFHYRFLKEIIWPIIGI
jgi:hypothetical protein